MSEHDLELISCDLSNASWGLHYSNFTTKISFFPFGVFSANKMEVVLFNVPILPASLNLVNFNITSFVYVPDSNR